MYVLGFEVFAVECVKVVSEKMGGGECWPRDDEGSLAWNWWNRASANPAEESRKQESFSSQATTEAGKKANIASAGPSQETEDLSFLTAVVPRQQPPPASRPAKSKPIDIPKKRTTPPPVFEVAQDKRYWYQ